MRFFAALLGTCLAWVTTAFGQGISVEVQFDQDYFLPHETLVAKVRITNFSGQTLTLGKDPKWLTFSVQGERGFIVPQVRDVPVLGEFELASAQVATRSVDIAPCYELSRPGRYRIMAAVRVAPGLPPLESPYAAFDLIKGVKIWEQAFGLPQPEGIENKEPEVRKYALVQTSHQARLRIYLRLSNAAESRVFKLISVGPMVSFSKPEPQLDRYSNLHLLYQVGPKTYLYSAVTPDGFIIARETYEASGSRPALKGAENGRIRVVGGVRRVAPSDIPPPEPEKQLTDVK